MADTHVKILQLSESAKLNGDNYVSWCMAMEPVIYTARCADLLPPISMERPTEAGDARDTWDAANRAGIASIIANINQSQYCYTRENRATLLNLWNAFATLYQPQGGQQSIQAMNKWQMARQGRHTSLQDHLEYMLKLRQGLRDHNVPNNEEQELLQLLLSLDEERYGATRDAILPWQQWPPVRGASQFSWVNVLAALKTKEAVKETTSSVDPPDQALNSAASSKNKKDETCYWCRRKGHRQDDCWARKRGDPKVEEKSEDSSGATTKKKAPRKPCPKCGKKGHWASDCRSKTKNRANMAEAEDHDEVGLISSSPDTTSPDK
eukprot:TRINITY_DN2240_c0_g2_i1.p1 TRINITY_DN2240_c0_g2~~TRINITY_DN2240_c0_g2_i1.p1  ORF type:complete len:322 (+),score=42.84 TRINITY_DN2240_c0_g2_i1:282-1247(+)